MMIGIRFKIPNEYNCFLKQILENNNILREGTEYDAKYEYYVSDIPEKFAVIAEEFLKKEIYDIKSIKI